MSTCFSSPIRDIPSLIPDPGYPLFHPQSGISLLIPDPGYPRSRISLPIPDPESGIVECAGKHRGVCWRKQRRDSCYAHSECTTQIGNETSFNIRVLELIYLYQYNVCQWMSTNNTFSDTITPAHTTRYSGVYALKFIKSLTS